MFSFHNSKEEISKGYDVVPQLNDNVRLTIEQYRNKLYSLIKKSDIDVPKSAKPKQQQSQQPAKQQQQQQKYDPEPDQIYESLKKNISSYNNGSNKQHQNEYQSDSNSGGSTPTPPPAQQTLQSLQQQYATA